MRIRLKTDKLAHHLAQSSISQNAWAHRMRLSTGYLSELVNGKKVYPSASVRLKLLKATGLSFDQLFEIESDSDPPVPKAQHRPPLLDVSLGGFRVKLEWTCPSQAGDRSMNAFLQDLRYGWRTLKREPLVTLVAVLTIALGIAGNVAMFSLVNGVLLTPLPFQDANRLMLVFTDDREEGDPFDTLSYPNFRDLRDRSRLFERLSVFRSAAYDVRLGDLTHKVQGARVSSDFFDVLGVPPVEGRFFDAEQDLETTPRLAILSHSFWQSRLQGNPEIIGQTLTLDGDAYGVVGILPPGFRFPVGLEDAEIWTPIGLDEGFLESRGTRWLTALGRLQKGVDEAAARSEADTIAAQLEEEYSTNRGEGLNLVPLRDYLVGPTRTALLLLLAAVGVVLLLACVNVASLSLARGASRRSEMALRNAIGASRRRLVRQLLTESLIMAVFGGLLGYVFAQLALGPMISLLPEEFPQLAEVTLDTRVLLFCLALTLFAALLFGVLPALRNSRTTPMQDLTAGRGAQALQGDRLRSLLVALQVALTLVLLVGAGLLIRSFYQLTAVDTGFDPESILVFQVSRPFADDTLGEQRYLYYQSLVQTVGQEPRVEAVGATTTLPFSSNNISVTFAALDQPEDSDKSFSTRYSAVTPGYFEVMGIPCLRGRLLDERDRRGAQGAVVVNEVFADQVWPRESALGKRIKLGVNFNREGEPEQFEVVGIVPNARSRAFDRPPEPEVFVSAAQHTWPFLSFVVKTAGDPEEFIAGVQRVASRVDPDQAVSGLRPLDELLSRSISKRRLAMLLLSVFAGLALVQATVGLYGLIAYQVARRIPEFGIRMAIGAGRSDVLMLVIKRGLKLTLTGLSVGLLAAFLVTRLLERFLFQLSPGDPLTFAAVTLILLLVALLASTLPALRATRLDPSSALR